MVENKSLFCIYRNPVLKATLLSFARQHLSQRVNIAYNRILRALRIAAGFFQRIQCPADFTSVITGQPNCIFIDIGDQQKLKLNASMRYLKRNLLLFSWKLLTVSGTKTVFL